MGVDSDCLLPRLSDLSRRNTRLLPYRRRVIGGAEGRVLEVGIGSGLNLPLYSPRMDCLLGLEPSPRLLAMAERAAQRTKFPVKLLRGSAESLPFEPHDVETVVMTWTGCSIPDILRALVEFRRVFRPSGRPLFVEHGHSPEPSVERWQDRLTPFWRRFRGGCHLNRKFDALIEDARFRITRLDPGYTKDLKLITYMYEGSARPT